VVNRNSCTFLVENEDTTAQERIKEQVKTIREALKNDPTLDELRANKFRERLAKLSGGIAVINVGGSTEVEILEKKDRVEDAVNATQAASQEGIIPGGGVALFYAAQHLKNLIRSGVYSNEKEGFIAGIQTVANACEVPLKTIVENTGESNEVVSNKLIENWTECKTVKLDMGVIDAFDEKDIEEFKRNILSQQKESENIDFKFRFGFDANDKTYNDLIKIGIIDPAKVARLALEHAVSVIGLMLTCNAVVVNEEEEK
jgi:chaperonin GroEL